MILIYKYEPINYIPIHLPTILEGLFARVYFFIEIIMKALENFIFIGSRQITIRLAPVLLLFAATTLKKSFRKVI